MTTFPAIRNLNRAPMHPGALLRDEILPACGKPKAEIARLLGISRQQLYDILDESRPVSPSVAVRLGKLFGNGPRLWANMQTAFDVWHAARETDVSHIAPLEVA